MTGEKRETAKVSGIIYQFYISFFDRLPNIIEILK